MGPPSRAAMRRRTRSSALDAIINWDEPKTHVNNPEGPQVNEGAPPNGADFIRLRAANDDYLTAGRSPHAGVRGSADASAATAYLGRRRESTGARQGMPPSTRRRATTSTARPFTRLRCRATGAQLTFENLYSMEEGYDYGYVQISDDGGNTWKTLSNNHTVDEGGFNGNSGCELGEQAPATRSGSTSRSTSRTTPARPFSVSFRYVTDGGVVEDGWWIDDVKVGDDDVDRRYDRSPDGSRRRRRTRSRSAGYTFSSSDTRTITPRRGWRRCRSTPRR